MTVGRLQRTVDEIHATSAQQWVLRFGAVAAALAAVAGAGLAAGRAWPVGLVAVPLLAFVSAIRPDRHTALAVVVIVMWHWLATVDEVTSPWLVIGAVCLVVYHSVIALSASVPLGGTLPRSVLARWAWTTTVVAGATLALWLAVRVLDGRDAAGNGLLTGVAVALLAGAAVALRARSLGAGRG